jgi:hypothetical protein
MPCRSHLRGGLLISLPLLDAELAQLQRTNRKEDAMSNEIGNSETIENAGTAHAGRWRLSLDSWAVLLALALAVLVKLHILNTVKW